MLNKIITFEGKTLDNYIDMKMMQDIYETTEGRFNIFQDKIENYKTSVKKLDDSINERNRNRKKLAIEEKDIINQKINELALLMINAS